jgi:hypothetical protein
VGIVENPLNTLILLGLFAIFPCGVLVPNKRIKCGQVLGYFSTATKNCRKSQKSQKMTKNAKI